MTDVITKTGRGPGKISYKTFYAALIAFIIALTMYLSKGSNLVDVSIQSTFSVGWVVAIFFSLILVIYDLLR